MQYYTYNNLNSQNEYQKVFVDGIQAVDREIAIGKELFQIFTTFSNETPLGALPLNGYTIYNCDTKLPEFWTQCVRRKANHTIPCVNTLEEWENQKNKNNGNCGKFVIINDGTVRLPCLNTVVLTNNSDLKNSNNVFGKYTSGDTGYHNHNNSFNLSIKKNDNTTTQIIESKTTTTEKRYWTGGDSDGWWNVLLNGSTITKDIYTISTTLTNRATGKRQCIPANIKVYYWIQVFSSYISQNIQGKLQIIQNILGENGSTLDNYLSLQNGRNS